MTDRTPGRPPPVEYARAALLLSSGGALVAYIMFDLPLAVAWLMLVGCGAALVWFLAVRSRTGVLPDRRVLRAGVVASVCALLAYDGSRVLLALAWTDVEPFQALPFFGAALLGPGAPAAAQLATGIGFHLVNGFAFGLAYTVLLGGRGVWTGVAWGIGLKLAMLIFYPAWLEIHGLAQFATMSLVGHVCYGAALGYAAQRMLRGSRAAAGTGGGRS